MEKGPTPPPPSRPHPLPPTEIWLKSRFENIVFYQYIESYSYKKPKFLYQIYIINIPYQIKISLNIKQLKYLL